MKIKRDINPEEILQNERHILFVEGEDENSIDPKFLANLFFNEQTIISIKPLKTSSSIKSVAESLYKYNPTYYFLIDRDYHDDKFVEKCWKNFPDPETLNLLVWRKKEIENYFLDPGYISQSRYCVKKDKIAQKVLDFANERFFLDLANRVIIEIRERFKENWIKTFDQPSKFSSREDTLTKLLSMNEFKEYCSKVKNGVSQKVIKRLFDKFFEEMSGGKEKLELGCGNWIDRMSGKKILTQLINSDCFCVKDSSNIALSGREKFHEVIKDLLKNAKNQPNDFIMLKSLIIKRINDAR